MANTFTAPTWVKAKPHASAEKQVGDSDPSARTDVVNRTEKGIYAIARRLINTLFNGATADFTDQATVSALAGDLLVYPRGYGYGGKLSNNAVDATNDIDIAAGEWRSDDAARADQVLLNPGAMTKQLDVVWAAGSAAGGRISGEALANGTWYVYAFRRVTSGTADDYCYSQSLTPALPDGGTKKRYMGSILREAAVIVPFDHDVASRRFLRKSPVLDVNANNPGLAAVTRTLSVPTGIQVEAIVNWTPESGAGLGQGVYVSDLAVNDDAASYTVAPLVNAGGSINASRISAQIRTRTNTSGQVRTRMVESDGNTNLRAATVGWIDLTGRDA